MSDLTGELIDSRYLLQRMIASGGMATIYAGVDTRLDRPVAVKIMHSHLANDEAFVSRFIKEAKATAALSHPNIVSIQDQGWNEGGPPAVFLVMELVEGSTLRDYLNEQGYKVVMITHERLGDDWHDSKLGGTLTGVINKTGNYPIEDRMVDIKHADV